MKKFLLLYLSLLSLTLSAITGKYPDAAVADNEHDGGRVVHFCTATVRGDFVVCVSCD